MISSSFLFSREAKEPSAKKGDYQNPRKLYSDEDKIHLLGTVYFFNPKR
jgi:hypothetical protein